MRRFRAAEALEQGKARTAVRTDPGMRARGSGGTTKRTEEQGLRNPELKEKGQLTWGERVGDAKLTKEENGASMKLMREQSGRGPNPRKEGVRSPKLTEMGTTPKGRVRASRAGDLRALA